MANVLLVTDSLPGATTSMAAMVASLASCLARRGHSVSVAGMGTESQIRAHRLSVSVPSLKHRSMIVRGAFELIGAMRLARLLRRAVAKREIGVPQLVVSFQPSLFLAVTTRLLKRWYDCRIFLVQRDLVPDWLVHSGRLRPGLATRFLEAFKEMSLLDADFVGIECEENRKFLAERHQNKIVVLENWRDYSAPSVRTGGPPERFTLVYGGRIGVAQGFDRFLDALLAAGLPDIVLRVYCDERGAKELAAMLARSTTELPGIEVNCMLEEQAFLSKAALCSIGVVSLSPDMVTHNIPGKLLGYLAAEVPVFAIGPENSALGRVVKESGVGVFAAADDKYEIATRLREVAADPLLLRRMKQNIVAAKVRFAVETSAALILSTLGCHDAAPTPISPNEHAVLAKREFANSKWRDS